MILFSILRKRIRSAHPDNLVIARGMAWVALFVMLGSFARAAREVAIAYRYGVSAEVDAYLFVFNLVSWPVSVWFSVLTVVLVPLAARLQQSDSAELSRFRAELLGLALMVGLTLALLGWLGLPVLVHSSWTGLSSATVTMASQIVPTLTLLAPLGVLISLFSAWMLAAGRHANTLFESLPALVLLLTLLVFSADGVEPLVWGTLGGFAFHLASLLVCFVRRGEVELPRITRNSAQWTDFWRGFGTMLVGQALMSSTGIVDQFFAAHLGSGAIATLNYANRILSLILGMGAMVVSRATLPVFSRAQAQGGGQLYSISVRWARLMFIFGLVGMIVAWWLALWCVKLVFERGAFTADNTAVVAEVLRYGLPQLPLYFSGLVLVSYLVSKRNYYAITVIGALNLVVKISSNLIIVPYFGIGGLMISTSVMLGASCLFLSSYVYKNYSSKGK